MRLNVWGFALGHADWLKPAIAALAAEGEINAKGVAPAIKQQKIDRDKAN